MHKQQWLQQQESTEFFQVRRDCKSEWVVPPYSLSQAHIEVHASCSNKRCTVREGTALPPPPPPPSALVKERETKARLRVHTESPPSVSDDSQTLVSCTPRVFFAVPCVADCNPNQFLLSMSLSASLQISRVLLRHWWLVGVVDGCSQCVGVDSAC
jgi:hypothetical protein